MSASEPRTLSEDSKLSSANTNNVSSFFPSHRLHAENRNGSKWGCMSVIQTCGGHRESIRKPSQERRNMRHNIYKSTGSDRFAKGVSQVWSCVQSVIELLAKSDAI